MCIILFICNLLIHRGLATKKNEVYLFCLKAVVKKFQNYAFAKPMVYPDQTYGLPRLNLWFSLTKPMVFSNQTYALLRLNLWFCRVNM